MPPLVISKGRLDMGTKRKLHPAVMAYLREISAAGGRASKGTPKNIDPKVAHKRAVKAAKARWKGHKKEVSK